MVSSKWGFIQNFVIYAIYFYNLYTVSSDDSPDEHICGFDRLKACHGPLGRGDDPPAPLPHLFHGMFPNVVCRAPEDKSARWRLPIVWDSCQDDRKADIVSPEMASEWTVHCARIPVPLIYELDGSHYLEISPLELEVRRLTRWKDYRKHSTFNPLTASFKEKGFRRNLAINQTEFDDRVRLKAKKNLVINIPNKLNMMIPVSNNHPYVEFSNDFHHMIETFQKTRSNIPFNNSWYSHSKPILTQKFLDANDPFQEYYPELYFTRKKSTEQDMAFNFKIITCDEIDDIINPLDPMLERVKDDFLQRPMTDPNYMADMSYSPVECYHTELASDDEVQYAITLLRSRGIDKIYDVIFEATVGNNQSSSYYVKYHKIRRWEEDIPKGYDPSKEYFNIYKKALSSDDVSIIIEKDIWDTEPPLISRKRIQKQPIGVRWNIFRDSKKDFLMFRNGRFYKRRFVPCPRLHLWMLEGGIGELYIKKGLIKRYADAIQEPFHIFIPEFRGEALLRSTGMRKDVNITKESLKKLFESKANAIRFATMDFASFDILFLIDRIHQLYPRPDSLNYIHATSYASLWAQRIAVINASSIAGLILDSPFSPTFNANEELVTSESEMMENLLGICNESSLCSQKFENIINDTRKYFKSAMEASNECHKFVSRSLGTGVDVKEWWMEGLTSHFINMGIGHLFLKDEIIPVDFRVLALALLYQAGRCKALAFFKKFFLLLFPHLQSSRKTRENERMHRPMRKYYSRPLPPSCPIIHYYVIFNEYWNANVSLDDIKDKSENIMSINMSEFYYHYSLYDLYKIQYNVSEAKDLLYEYGQRMYSKAIPRASGSGHDNIISAHIPVCPLPNMTVCYTPVEPYIQRKMLNLSSASDEFQRFSMHSTEPTLSCTCCCPSISNYSKPLAYWPYEVNYTSHSKDGEFPTYFENPYLYKNYNHVPSSENETWKQTGWIFNSSNPKIKNPPRNLSPFNKRYINNTGTVILLLHGHMNTRVSKSEVSRIYNYSQVGRFYRYNFWRGGHNIFGMPKRCIDGILHSFFNFTRLPWNPMNVFPMNASWAYPYHITDNVDQLDLISKLLVHEIFLYSDDINSVRIALERSNLTDNAIIRHLRKYLLYDGLSSKSRCSFGSPEHLPKKENIQWSQTISIDNILDYIRVMADDNSLFRNYPHYSFSWNYYMAWRNVAYRGLNMITDSFGRKRIYFSFGGDRFMKPNDKISTMTSAGGHQFDGMPRAQRCSCHIVGPDTWLPINSISLTHANVTRESTSEENYWISLLDSKYLNDTDAYHREFIEKNFELSDDKDQFVLARSECMCNGIYGNYSILYKYNSTTGEREYFSEVKFMTSAYRSLVKVEKEYLAKIHLFPRYSKSLVNRAALRNLYGIFDSLDEDNIYQWNTSIYGIKEDENLILAPSSVSRIYLIIAPKCTNGTCHGELFPEHKLPMESRLFTPESIVFPSESYLNPLNRYCLENQFELYDSIRSHPFATGVADVLSMSELRNLFRGPRHDYPVDLKELPSFIRGYKYEAMTGNQDHNQRFFDFCTSRFIFDGKCRDTSETIELKSLDSFLNSLNSLDITYDDSIIYHSDGNCCHLYGWINELPMYLLPLETILVGSSPLITKIVHQGLALILNDPSIKYVFMEQTLNEFILFSGLEIRMSLLSMLALPRSKLSIVQKVIFSENLTHVSTCDAKYSSRDDDPLLLLGNCSLVNIKDYDNIVINRTCPIHFKYEYDTTTATQIRKYYTWIIRDSNASEYIEPQTIEESQGINKPLDRNLFSWSWPLNYESFLEEIEKSSAILISAPQSSVHGIKIVLDTEGTLNSLLDSDYFHIDPEIYIPKGCNASLPSAWIGTHSFAFARTDYFELKDTEASESKDSHDSFNIVHRHIRNLYQKCSKCLAHFSYDDDLYIKLVEGTDVEVKAEGENYMKGSSWPDLEMFSPTCSIREKFDELQERVYGPCRCIEELNFVSLLEWNQYRIAQILGTNSVFSEPTRLELLGIFVGVIIAIICTALIIFFLLKYLRYSLSGGKRAKADSATKEMMANVKSRHRRQMSNLSFRYRRANQVHPEGYQSSVQMETSHSRNQEGITFERSQRRVRSRQRISRRSVQPMEAHQTLIGLDLSYRFGEDDTTSISSYTAPSFDLRRALDIEPRMVEPIKTDMITLQAFDNINSSNTENEASREAFKMMAKRRASAPTLRKPEKSQVIPMEVDWFDTDEEASLVNTSEDENKMNIDLERGHTTKQQGSLFQEHIPKAVTAISGIKEQNASPKISDDSVVRRQIMRNTISPKNYKSRYIPNNPDDPIVSLKKKKE